LPNFNSIYYIVYKRLERLLSGVGRVVENIAYNINPKPVAIDAEALEPLIL
jgi:hypothetical protein